MTDPIRHSGADYDRESPSAIPGWLKVVGVAIAIVVLLFLAMMLVPGHTIGGH